MCAVPSHHLRQDSAVHSLSIVVPIYLNEENIPSLLDAVRELIARLGDRAECVFVVDGSPDQSLAMLRAALPAESFDAQLIAHSRNFGSFAAIRTGLRHARGVYIGAMAADLQEPPELLMQMFELLRREEADIVFGQRIGRDDPVLQHFASALFWKLYRFLVLRDMPTGGVDIFACTDGVRRALLSWEEARSSIVAQLFWMGFRRAFVPYHRRKRLQGRSAWSLRKRLDYFFDSIFSFTELPIHALFWLGMIGIAVSVIAAIVVFGAWLFGRIPVPGYTPIVLLLTFLSSVQICALGIIGFYLWRVSENARRRPLTLIRSAELFDKSTPRT